MKKVPVPMVAAMEKLNPSQEEKKRKEMISLNKKLLMRKEMRSRKEKLLLRKKDKWTEKPAPKKNVGNDGDKSNTEDEAKDGKKSKGKGVREKNKNRKDEDKWKGKVSGKTGTKSSRNTRKGKKDDGEKSESAQQERIQPGTSQNSSQSDKKGKLEKDEPILHIGGNEILPYACGICKNRFFLPRSLLCHIEQAHKRKESSSDSESDEPQLAKIKPLKSGHPSGRNCIESDSEDDGRSGNGGIGGGNREDSGGDGEGGSGGEEGGGNGEEFGKGDESGNGEEGGGE